MIDYANSIVIIGGVGVGKTLVSNRLASIVGMEKLTVDEFRHLPLMKDIKNTLSHPDLPPRMRDEYLRYKHLREKYPNIRNYSQFGFKPAVSQYLEHNFGKVAWHYYQKAFENMLVLELCEKLDGAVILDIGGGMPVSLDNEYSRLRSKFETLDRKLFYKEFNHLDMVGKGVTHAIYERFDNVVYLKSPEHKVDKSERAQDGVITKYFEISGDYETVADITIDTTGLYVGGKYVEEKLDNIVRDIEDKVSISVDTM